ncbi:MAG TPA: PEP-utilizing enzyme [Dehalococcoidia bacterium]|nr:PEP-utilizing enzyme [Dehalococcoidia bacterium]
MKFELPNPALEQYRWILFDEHGPPSLPPLLGGEAPWGAMGGPGSGDVPRALRINGFLYMRDGLMPGQQSGNPFGNVVELKTREDARRWRDVWLPEVDKVVAAFEAFDAASVAPGTWEATLNAQGAEYMRVFGGVHGQGVLPSNVATEKFRDAYLQRFGEASNDDCQALLQGSVNCSLDRAAMLWDLSRIAREDAAVMDAITDGSPLPESPAGRRFDALLRETLDRFGSTSNAEMQDMPTWREDASIPLASVRAFAAQPDGHGPREASEAARRRRLELEATLRKQAETDATVAALLPLLEVAQEHLPTTEDHNFLADERMQAASRMRWLSIGRLLQTKGAIGDPEDVFLLNRRELLAALEANVAPSRDELRERRAFREACILVAAPPVLGKATEASLEPLVIRGIAASQGTYRGRAVLVDTLDEAAERLKPGDILVCRSTTPPWTPFFGIIGALVTNSGGALSHAAVVAREFGIPAVVGTTTATTQVRDGATITVDGSAGTVTLED